MTTNSWIRKAGGWMVGSAMALAAGGAMAQSGSVRLILPVSAGSGVDTIVRAAQDKLSEHLGRSVVIENLPGAGGVTGTHELVKAKPDGHTFGIVSNNHAVNPSVFKSLPYDSLDDITPISVLGSTPFVLVVNPDRIPARNAKELQALLQDNPGKYNYASSGNGTIIHLAGAMFMQAADVEVQHIPYKGMGQAITDLIGGQVEMGVAALPAVQGHLKSGTLYPIGVMGQERVALMPDLPTIAEQGFPEVDMAGWFAAVAPAGLPDDTLQTLHEGIVAAFTDPAVEKRLNELASAVHPDRPDEARAFMTSEQQRFGDIARASGLQPD